jgi:sugar lactone lactonase YvrE
MFGANGIRAGADGRLYVAELVGSRISAVDPDSGSIDVVSAMGGGIISPDDLAFDDHGSMYVTEFMDNRLTVREPDGRVRVMHGDVPGANGITIHNGKLYVDECRLGGRLLEFDLAGGGPRVVLDDLPLPNALAPGPDGKLYYPLIGPGEVWRVDPAGGEPERVASGLHHPSAVKFDARDQLVVTQAATGEIRRIDPGSGSETVLATLGSAIDNLTFLGDRLFVSHMMDGRISEVHADGSWRDILPGGLHNPLDLAIGNDGLLYVADQIALYVLIPGEGLNCLGRIYTEDYPGGVRGLAPAADRSFYVTTANGRIVLYRPWQKEFDVLAEGLDQLYGIAILPSGAITAAEQGTGRIITVENGQIGVLASGLSDPIGIAIDASGDCYVSESGAGRIVRIAGGRTETVLDGLRKPQGLLIDGSRLLIVDAGAQELVAYNLERGTRQTLAAHLPVGDPPGVSRQPLRGCPPFVGPLGPFAGIAKGRDGTIYFSADAEGSIMTLVEQASR